MVDADAMFDEMIRLRSVIVDSQKRFGYWLLLFRAVIFHLASS